MSSEEYNFRYYMSTSQGSMPEFARQQGTRFLRTLAAVTLLVGVIALPAAVVVLGLLPAAAGYLVVAMGSLALIVSGAWDTGTDSDEPMEIGSRNSRETIFVVAILYAVIAGAFSLLLLVSAGLGFLATQFGYPTVGLVLSAGYPYVDNWLSGVDGRLSVVNLGCTVIALLLRGLSVLYAIPGSLVDEANYQRRNLY